MKIDLDRNDIVNILTALNAMQVRGKENIVALLRLIQKTEDALILADAVKAEPPRSVTGPGLPG